MSTQNDWESQFDLFVHYLDDNGDDCQDWAVPPERVKIFIRKLLADARREGHELGRAELVEFEVEKARREERANIIDLIQDEHNFTWVGVEGMCLIKDIVATLREEEGAVK